MSSLAKARNARGKVEPKNSPFFAESDILVSLYPPETIVSDNLNSGCAAAPTTPPQPLFALGQLVGTPGAIKALEDAELAYQDYVARHHAGIWGDLSAEDREANDAALLAGGRLLSAYVINWLTGAKIWIITEADRSATTILLPEEY